LNALEELQREQLAQSIQQALLSQQQQQQQRQIPSMDQQHGRSNDRTSKNFQEFDHHNNDNGDHHDYDEEEEEDEDNANPPAPRRMLRDRLMNQGGRGSTEQLYHNPMGMKQDPVKPPQPMGPEPLKKRNGGQRGSVSGGNVNLPEQTEFYGNHNDKADHYDDTVQALGKYRSHPGDQQISSHPFGTNATGMGRFQGSDRHAPSPITSQHPRGEEQEKTERPQRQNLGSTPSTTPDVSSNTAQSRRRHDTNPPPDTPNIDRKLQHFLQETVTNGPKDHFDKEMEALLLEKYRPQYPWLKTSNVQFLRSVLTTFLKHNGAQIEMDLQDASEQATYEWEELLSILKMELCRMTGVDPRIEAEGDHQWGIYNNNNTNKNHHNRNNNNINNNNKNNNKNNNNNSGRPGVGGISAKENERHRNRNSKIYVISDGAA
jgi:hypothetical protein